MNLMSDCPKFQRCSAPVCPLDQQWRERRQTSEDPVCFYLQEAVKDGGIVRVRHGTSAEMAEHISKVLDELSNTYGHSYIQYRLRRAASTGSRIAGADRLKVMGGVRHGH